MEVRENCLSCLRRSSGEIGYLIIRIHQLILFLHEFLHQAERQVFKVRMSNQNIERDHSKTSLCGALSRPFFHSIHLQYFLLTGSVTAVMKEKLFMSDNELMNSHRILYFQLYVLSCIRDKVSLLLQHYNLNLQT